MRFLLDQGLPRSLARLLGEDGHQAEHVADLGLSTVADEIILAAAKDRGAVVITLDADFHGLLALARAHRPSVVRLRVQGLKGPELRELMT